MRMIVGPKFEVFKPIVVPDSVFVMNRLVWIEAPSEMLFHDSPMFRNILRGIGIPNMGVTSCGCFPLSTTILRVINPLAHTIETKRGSA